MISVVIRNKNEAKALGNTLFILNKVYADFIDEIIIVDNNSIDDSIKVAQSYGCKTINIENFTYGKATNLGIENARNNFVLLLSAHAVPIGNSFFKTAIEQFNSDLLVAGLRFINSYSNYLRAAENDFQIKDGLSFGLMTACAMVNKKVWEKYFFDENLVFSEDKEWSDRVIKAGYKILDCNESFFYQIQRDEKGSLDRIKNETIAHYQLHKLKYPSILKIFLIFLKNMVLTIPKEYFERNVNEVKLLFLKLKIRNRI